MIKNCSYYWEKVAKLSFSDRFTSTSSMLEEAEKYLSKDELEHLKELLKDGE